MKLEFVEGAEEDLEQLSDRQLREIKRKVSELREDPTGHSDSKLIEIAGRKIYRLKVRQSRGGEIDHRVIYDVKDGGVRVYGVFHRDRGYDDGKLSDRL